MFKRTYKRNIPLLAGLEFTSYFGITSFWILFLGTIYQFTLDTRYSIFENIKKDDFQTETVF